MEPYEQSSATDSRNTNGRLRQYFPKGTDLNRVTKDHLDSVAAVCSPREPVRVP